MTNDFIKLLLKRRSMTEEDLTKIEEPYHDNLQGLDEFCEILHDVHEKNEHIVIIPDFDMDGIMSATIGYAGMSELGFDVNRYTPDARNGYGFSAREIDEIVKTYPDVKAIITCDTGIGCLEGVKHAKELGLKTLITDHHIETIDETCREYADAIVNPCAIGETYKHPSICGAFVFYQVLERYGEMYADRDILMRIKWLRIFAGIGTVSDTMPVLYENRKVLKDSFKIFKELMGQKRAFSDMLEGASEAFKDAFRGLYLIFKKLESYGNISDPEDIDEDIYGFYISPAFNSMKRLDENLAYAYDVFCTTNGDDEVDGIGKCVKKVFETNLRRKEIVKEEIGKLAVKDNLYAPYIYETDARHGLVGLLASKFSSDNGMPVVVIEKNSHGGYSGSGRSPEWIDFRSVLKDAGYFARGHEHAFGFSTPDGDMDLEKLYNVIAEAVEEREKLGVIDSHQYDVAISACDNATHADFVLSELDMLEICDEIESMKPFGKGFEKPIVSVVIDFDNCDENIDVFKIGSAFQHLKIRLAGLDIISWNNASLIDDGGLDNGIVEFVGYLSVNEFRGNRTAMLTAGEIAKRG